MDRMALKERSERLADLFRYPDDALELVEEAEHAIKPMLDLLPEIAAKVSRAVNLLEVHHQARMAALESLDLTRDDYVTLSDALVAATPQTALSDAIHTITETLLEALEKGEIRAIVKALYRAHEQAAGTEESQA